jgi:NodT family efflux transporter outer membrane factor (OMF) lipoprotein
MAGCTTTSGVSTPVQTPSDFSRSGSASVPDRWWKTFDDPALNSLVNSAIEGNFTLKTAYQRLEAARAVVERSSASLYPSLDATASASTSRGGSAGDQESFSLGFTADYELDLWGRIQANIQAEQFRLEATRADYKTAAISLSAEVARTWYQLVESRRQMNLINDQIETNQQVLELIKSQFGTGQVASADLLRQRRLLESTREQLTSVEAQVDVLEHQLAVLLGKPPQTEIAHDKATIPEVPPLPKTGVPIQLLQRRPDVRSAFLQLKAADRDLAAAITNQYPRLTFTASLGTSDNDASELFDDWARSFAGNLMVPLLDAGQRDAEVSRARAVKKQRLYEYGQAMLTALQDVENSLVREREQVETIKSLRKQLELTQETVNRLQTQYFNGAVSYIEVLNALTEEQQLRRDLITARRLLVEQRIALYRALAGGFETNRETGS